MHPKVLTFRGEPIIGKTSVKPINRLVFSKSANCRRLSEWSAVSRMMKFQILGVETLIESGTLFLFRC